MATTLCGRAPARPHPRWTVLAACPLALLLAACSGHSGTGIDHLGTSSAMATGVVRDAGGTPVVGAAVRFLVYRTCSDTLGIGSGASTVELTDATGTYRGRVLAPVEPGAFCVEARASRSASDTAQSVSARAGPINFRVTDGPEPYDTAHIDLIVP